MQLFTFGGRVFETNFFPILGQNRVEDSIRRAKSPSWQTTGTGESSGQKDPEGHPTHAV